VPSCNYQKADGTTCKANALPGSSFCYFHDPARERERAEARRKGGRERSKKAAVLPAMTPDVEIKDVASVVRLLGETISQVRTGAIDPKIANAVGYLASVQLRAMQESELARQVEEHGRELAAFKTELETMKRGQRNAQKAAGPSANGTQRSACGDGKESALGSDPGGRRRDPEAGLYDAGPLADEIAPYFD
jgi:hypothetical protein